MIIASRIVRAKPTIRMNAATFKDDLETVFQQSLMVGVYYQFENMSNNMMQQRHLAVNGQTIQDLHG